ncbi:SpoIIE family protein phosphatase [Terriglobus tenax]|uniref:SpoIIE family protein phosphatase n=1 Tax=Terriglobus tenax TaxID=1111115 RepID=UPI0021DF8FBA|nr:SpoIIE family protein phosphatase [Terriglobus tenax]
MASSETTRAAEHTHEFEGDYRPSDSASAPPPRVHIEPLQIDFLTQLADALNNTLDLQTTMQRVADLVRAVIDYKIFAILLINDRTQDFWMRFQIGHTPESERMRVKSGKGVIGRAAELRRPVLVEDVTKKEYYIPANPDVQSELAIPLITKNKVIGVLDIESTQIGYFTQEHQRLLELVASRIAIAIENARLYTRVSRQAQTLTVLSEISKELTSILDLDDLLERVGQLLKRVVDFQMFSILLWNPKSKQFEHRFSTKFGERVQRQHVVEPGQGIIGTAAQERMPILVPDVRKDPRYIAYHPETRSELAVPLVYKDQIIGVLDVEHTRSNYYNEDHQRTFTTLAGQVAIAIENARLYERILEEEQRMERDLAMARQVQLRLLPSTPPSHPHADFFAKFLPARSIGGDVYDFLDYGQGRTLIVMGDVSGKAAPAALYAALVSGILRSLGAQQLSPAQMLAALNDQLQERKLDAQYVTMLIALWDDTEQTLRIANAGSVQPLFVTGGEVRTIQAEGFPLGLFPHAVYEELTLATQPGDQIVFFSDGITDAENAAQEMFGNERLVEVLRKLKDPTAQITGDAILKSVGRFQSQTEHFDDETVVILHVR